MHYHKALMVVDMQNDFFPGGALAVDNADQILPVVNRYIDCFEKAQLPIFFSRDWHPETTKHFQGQGGVWPMHCVQNTKGAEFVAGLRMPDNSIIASKGMDPTKDSYSVFDGESPQQRPIFEVVKDLGVKELFFCGLATDYCVKDSVLDALHKGFDVKVMIDAIKAVDLHPDDSEKALDLMKEAGADEITFKDLPRT
jgi:nicotinamidase/pyrazinamidase